MAAAEGSGHGRIRVGRALERAHVSRRRIGLVGADERAAELRAAGAEGKGSRDPTPVHDPPGGDHGNLHAIRDLGDERHRTDKRGLELDRERAAMAARLAALGDDGVAAGGLDRRGLGGGRRRPDQRRSRVPQRVQRALGRDPEREAEHGRRALEQDLELDLERRLGMGRRLARAEPERIAVRREAREHSRHGLGCLGSVERGEQVDREGLVAELVDRGELLAELIGPKGGAAERAQAAGVGDRRDQLRRVDAGHRRLDQRIADPQQAGEWRVRPSHESRLARPARRRNPCD